MSPTFGSLFAGIGGFDLGLERAGWACRWQVEIDPFCQRVLAKHWPDVERYGDIRTLDLDAMERVDLVCGGFPCQPASNAGKREGLDDDRWLWPEFARVIRALRPSIALLENVPGLLSVNGGVAFGQILGDLAEIGYDAEWDCVSAADLGAPHLRERVWLVAYAQRDILRHESGGRNGARGYGAPEPRHDGPDGAVADAAGPGLEVWRDPVGLWQFAATIGSGQWAVEPDVGRVAHGVPARIHRLRTLGNAIVPQIAEYIGRRLVATNTHGGKGGSNGGTVERGTLGGRESHVDTRASSETGGDRAGAGAGDSASSARAEHATAKSGPSDGRLRLL